MMGQLELNKIIYSIVTVVVISLLDHFLKRLAKRTQKKFGIRKSRYFALKRLIGTTMIALGLVAVFVIWKIDFKHAWVSMTGLFALVAVAFFAVWSLIGNILAGIILYFTSPFKIEDTIEVIPDNVFGKVLAINTFYTIIQDEEMNYINIPNSLFFQKYVKVIKRTAPSSQEVSIENPS